MSNTVTTVTSPINPLAYAKAIATLVGTIVTGLLGVYTPDTPAYKALVIISIITTAIATWAVPNALVVPAVTDTGEVIEGEADEDEGDDGHTYEESGGLPFPSDADEAALYTEPRAPGDSNPHRY